MTIPVFGNRQTFTVEQSGENVFTLRTTADAFQALAAVNNVNDYFACVIEHNNGKDFIVFGGWKPTTLARYTSSNPVQITVPAQPIDASQKSGIINSLLSPGDVNAGTPNSVADINFSTGEHTLVVGPDARIFGTIVDAVNPNWLSFTSGDNSPSIRGYNKFVTAGATPIIDFDDARPGQRFTVYRGNADISITHSSGVIEMISGSSETLTEKRPFVEFIEKDGVFLEASPSLSLLDIQDVVQVKTDLQVLGNPNYPAANKGHVYRIVGDGLIGGASGTPVKNGQTITCFVDDSPEGNHATVGANWFIAGGSGKETAELVTKADLEDISSAINTTGKTAFKYVKVARSGGGIRFYFCQGTAAGEPWTPDDDQSGMSDVTPV